LHSQAIVERSRNVLSVAYQLESWPEALAEIIPLSRLLWEDVAVDKERFVTECDLERYNKLHELGMLQVVTARIGKRLIGFIVSLVGPNVHYKGAGTMVNTDAYFILPEYRKGNIGIQMFSFAEETWRAMGIVKAYSSHKIHKDRSGMFALLGWRATDIVYTKVL
jgi:GNAT superfamily N-acetyltransferase